jgi:hypothetical protein
MYSYLCSTITMKLYFILLYYILYVTVLLFGALKVSLCTKYFMHRDVDDRGPTKHGALGGRPSRPALRTALPLVIKVINYIRGGSKHKSFILEKITFKRLNSNRNSINILFKGNCDTYTSIVNVHSTQRNREMKVAVMHYARTECWCELGLIGIHVRFTSGKDYSSCGDNVCFSHQTAMA